MKELFDAQRKVAAKEQEALIANARGKAKIFMDESREKIQLEYRKAREELFSQTKVLGTDIAAHLTHQESQK